MALVIKVQSRKDANPHKHVKCTLQALAPEKENPFSRALCDSRFTATCSLHSMAPVLQDPQKMNMSSAQSVANTDGRTTLTVLLTVTGKEVMLILDLLEENVQIRHC
jgi:hypothetical protein